MSVPAAVHPAMSLARNQSRSVRTNSLAAKSRNSSRPCPWILRVSENECDRDAGLAENFQHGGGRVGDPARVDGEQKHRIKITSDDGLLGNESGKAVHATQLVLLPFGEDAREQDAISGAGALHRGPLARRRHGVSCVALAVDDDGNVETHIPATTNLRRARRPGNESEAERHVLTVGFERTLTAA